MGKATINLAKGYEPSKLNYPVAASIKLDGVPVKITVTVQGISMGFKIETRQGEFPISIENTVRRFVLNVWDQIMKFEGEHVFVAEVTQRNNMFAPFKDTSGIVRRQEHSDELKLNFFEYQWVGGDEAYLDRICLLNKMLLRIGPSEEWAIIPFTICADEEDLDRYVDYIFTAFPDAEGCIARSYDDKFVPNKRSWGYQKILREPTIDLRITGFEEAVSKDGEPLGMVGRMIASYHGEHIGIGPGKSSHAERRTLWEQYRAAQASTVGWHSPVAKIKYKKDDSYSALRQPTFQCWADKDEPDA